MSIFESNPLVVPAIISVIGVIYTAWASNRSSKKVKTINDNLGEFAKQFAPAAGVAEQFTALNKSLFKALEDERNERRKEQVIYESKIRKIEGELDDERKDKLELLGQVQTLQIQIGDLEKRVRDAIHS